MHLAVFAAAAGQPSNGLWRISQVSHIRNPGILGTRQSIPLLTEPILDFPTSILCVLAMCPLRFVSFTTNYLCTDTF